MKNICKILIPFVFLLNNAFCQQQTKIKLKDDGIVTLSFGVAIHTSTFLLHYNNKLTPPQKGGVIFASTVGVGLYIISFKKEYKKSNPKL